MTLSIGIDHGRELWKICLTEDGNTLECSTFDTIGAALAYVEQTCALYPEPIIALSSLLVTPLRLLSTLSESEIRRYRPAVCSEGQMDEVTTFLKAVGEMSLKSYLMPAIPYTTGVPLYRRLLHENMGGAATLCAIATLLYRLRMQDAAWSEISLLYLEIAPTAYSITVIKEGSIIDGLSRSFTGRMEQYDERELEEAMVEQVFWEGLTRDMAGIFVIHHVEDIVMVETELSSAVVARKDTVTERFEENYRFYQFPTSEAEKVDFEIAQGAALLAEGLYRPGLAQEVTKRLLPLVTEA